MCKVLKSFKSIKELQTKIDEYFKFCVDEHKPYTVTGLALYLDCDRDTLLNYEKKEAYFGTIKKAKLRIHNYAEESLWTARNTTGVIFNLKNNWDWKDKTEIDQNISGELKQSLIKFVD